MKNKAENDRSPSSPAAPPRKPPQRGLTDGQRAYEAKRAAKAGMPLEKWLAAKDREAADAARAQEKARQAEVKSTKRPGFIKRFLDRAHKPL